MSERARLSPRKHPQPTARAAPTAHAPCAPPGIRIAR